MSTLYPGNDLPDLVSAATRPHSLGKQIFLVLGGVIVVALGFIGWILPFVPGVPLVVIGIGMIAMVSDRLKTWINRIERQLPHQYRLLLRPALRGKR
jgi:hypothetical protein